MPGKLRRDHLHRRLLLFAVDDEFAADHGDVGIDAVLAVETVGAGVNAHETLAGLDRRQKLFLPFGRHRLAGLRVSALPRQHASRVENEGVVLIEIAVEDRAVLAADDLEAGLLSPLGKRLFRRAQFCSAAGDRKMLVAGAAGEIEHFLLLPLGGGDPAQRKGRRAEQAAPEVNNISRRFMTSVSDQGWK